MSTEPAPTTLRGEITLQPSYFTSSLYVYPLREDISLLTQAFSERYIQSARKSPFALFKTIWNEQGWTWLHFKVFDARAREKFLEVTLRLFAERAVASSHPMAKVVALFGMYTFFYSQPSTSTPSLHSIKHIALPIDIFNSLLAVPISLFEPSLRPLQPYATHVLSTLLDSQAFHILPESSLRPQNPSVLPREYFIPDDADPAAVLPAEATAASSNPAKSVKKKGRPSKRDKAKRAKDAVTALDRWLDKNTYTYPSLDGLGLQSPEDEARATHVLIAHRPVTLQQNYISQKAQLLDVLEQMTISSGADGAGPSAASTGRDALLRANEAILMRLRKIDEMAAEQGLEVGGEGGDMTGLARVEKAVTDLREGRSRGGVLNLLEGAGAGVTQCPTHEEAAHESL